MKCVSLAPVWLAGIVAVMVCGCTQRQPPAEAPATASPTAPASVTPGEATPDPAPPPPPPTGDSQAPAVEQSTEPVIGKPMSADAPPPVARAPVTSAAPGGAELRKLTLAVRAFAKKNGTLPTNVDELVGAGLINQVPAAPAGHRYDIDAGAQEVKLVSE